MPRRDSKGEGGRRKAENRESSFFAHFSANIPLPSSAFALLRLLGCCLCVLLATGAQAQTQTPTALPAALEMPEAARPQQRAQLQQELEHQAQTLEAQSAVVKIVAKLIGPAVVHIEADVPPDGNSSYARSRHVEEAGSGVIILRSGKYYVLTNRHVVRDAPPAAIKINLADGRRIHPTKVLQDPKTDVAVMSISAPDLVAAKLGDSTRMEIGDFVLAVGSPFGLSHSVTFGIISAKGRRALHLGEVDSVEFQDFLQTDAAINPGNSGGPLVNLRGEVIGINTAIASNSGGNEGIGFAIPVNMFMAVGRQLIETGVVTRAFLGVKLNSKFGPAMAAELGLPRPVGAHISVIVPNSPAEAAKLQTGDVILEFNRTPIEDDAHLMNLVSLTEIGKSVPVVIFRDRKPLTVMVEVGDRSRFPD
jgi:serine protease Do